MLSLQKDEFQGFFQLVFFFVCFFFQTDKEKEKIDRQTSIEDCDSDDETTDRISSLIINSIIKNFNFLNYRHDYFHYSTHQTVPTAQLS